MIEKYPFAHKNISILFARSVDCDTPVFWTILGENKT
jgi:hypothetical protein